MRKKVKDVKPIFSKHTVGTDNKKGKSFLGKEWWSGLGVVISFVTFLMVFYQTQKLHSDTDRLNKQMRDQAEIQRIKDNIEKYLQYGWYDKAIRESNQLNLTLKSVGIKDDSTCYNYLSHLHNHQIKAGHNDAAAITLEYRSQLK